MQDPVQGTVSFAARPDGTRRALIALFWTAASIAALLAVLDLLPVRPDTALSFIVVSGTFWMIVVLASGAWRALIERMSMAEGPHALVVNPDGLSGPLAGRSGIPFEKVHAIAWPAAEDRRMRPWKLAHGKIRDVFATTAPDVCVVKLVDGERVRLRLHLLAADPAEVVVAIRLAYETARTRGCGTVPPVPSGVVFATGDRWVTIAGAGIASVTAFMFGAGALTAGFCGGMVASLARTYSPYGGKAHDGRPLAAREKVLSVGPDGIGGPLVAAEPVSPRDVAEVIWPAPWRDDTSLWTRLGAFSTVDERTCMLLMKDGRKIRIDLASIKGRNEAIVRSIEAVVAWAHRAG